MNDTLTQRSKFLSKVLRHDPGAIGIELDENGWADVSELLEGMARAKKRLSLQELEEIVRENNKKRFAFSEDHLRIRASQGHSIDIDLGLEPKEPPEILFHGTALKFLDSIKATGLAPGKRQYVHLSVDVETAMNVGRRHGKPVALKIKAKLMSNAGHKFWISDNGVWLALSVPAEYIEF
ncbi:MAG: RNA 2'-phosphotransferase [Clostridiales bacterium]|nr:RNA 2'-phosphotransferase [Clostridiales bacterium]